MRSKVLSLLIMLVLLASAACTPQAATVAPTTAPSKAPAATLAATPAATQAAAPAKVVPAGAKSLTVLAAASLTESFTELGKLFESKNAGTSVVFSFAGSQQLAQQLEQGIEADVFASANTKYMDSAIQAKRVKKEDSQTFAQNRLVVISPKENKAGIKELKDLSKSGLKLVLADKAVPVGQYAIEFLDKAVKDSSFGAAYKEDVLKNVVSYEDNVKSVLTKVSLGEADAGIVYATDITPSAAGKVNKLDIPDALNTIATYPLAPIADSKNAELAKGFVSLVMSADGQAILAKYGFIAPTPSKASASGSNSAAGGYTVTDALGRKVNFNKVPQKIVLTGKALFMVADAIYLFPEAGKNIVALGSTAQGSGNFIPMIDSSFSSKITLDSNAGPEQIAAAQPDCVVMKSSNAEKLGKPLEALKIPVVYVDFETPEQYERDLKTLGELFQNPERAAKIAAFYKSKVDSISKTVSQLKDEQKVRALILYYTEKDGAVTFNVPPMDWMQTTQIKLAGGLPVWKDANPGSGWTKVNLEQVAAWNPDVIFVVAYFNPVKDVVKNLKADPKWQPLKAVKDNKVYGYATDVYSWDQPDTRWTLGVAWVAAKLYPDLFKAQDLTQEAKTFYKELYGMEDASFQKNIQPLLAGGVN